jgi:mannose-6-phosphate isomerase-like protein (cupin superfamily)
MSAFQLEKITKENENLVQIISTTKYMQLVLMSLTKNKNLPFERLIKSDQFIKVEKGDLSVVLGEENEESIYDLKIGDSINIPRNTRYGIFSKKGAKLYRIYSPPNRKLINLKDQ